jgi:hypothetical protein
MKLQKHDFAQIIGLQPQELSENVKYSLFVVSKKSPRLKAIHLEMLSSTERAVKMRQWATQCRFVAVIEMNDKIYAHVDAQFASQLELQKDLNLDGKQVIVKSLSEDESEKLSQFGSTFVPNKDAYTLDSERAAGSVVNQNFVGSQLFALGENKISSLRKSFEQFLEKLQKKTFKQLDEQRQQDKIVQKEHEKREIEKREFIQRKILQKEIITTEVKHNEINRQNLKNDNLKFS